MPISRNFMGELRLARFPKTYEKLPHARYVMNGMDLRPIILAAALLLPAAGVSQGHAHDSTTHAAMSGAMAAGAHVRVTAKRAMTGADSVKAMELAETLRRALGVYKDTAAAVHDGYKLFLPNVKNQKVYHFTKWSEGFWSAFRWNPSKPTSLLYRRDSTTGRLKLIGAMYTMPRRAPDDALNKRVPLSVAQWHLHTNLCVPRKGEESRFSEKRDGTPIFGLEGTIATKAACDAERGVFREHLFGWMVHANVYEGTDLATVWQHK
jgi:hypothetical protein